MKKRKRAKSFIKSIITGAFAVFIFLAAYITVNNNTSPFILVIRNVFPMYDESPISVVNLYAYEAEPIESEAFFMSRSGDMGESEIIPGDLDQGEAEEKIDDIKESGTITEIIGINNVIYQPGTDITINNNPQTNLITSEDMDKLKDFNYLKSSFYTVDKRTALLPDDIDPEEFLQRDFRLDRRASGPKVLIIHTHSQEGYSDSVKGDLNDGIFAVGEKLADTLKTKYNIETIHDKSSYDVVNGKSSTLGAYERMEKSVEKILTDNPTVEMVIDLHRDGVGDNLKFVTDINGKQTAKIMFFNGLCRVYKNGELNQTEGLFNPYVKDNLALSFKLQLLANEMYPNFTRRAYINAYRYSLHFKPKSLLIEVGAQTNTKQEALNAVEPLAEMLGRVL